MARQSAGEGGKAPWRGFVCAALSCALVLAAWTLRPAHASEKSPGLTQLGVERWGREDGLGASWVRDIAEAPDGFLWVATSSGLSRFDGRRFRHYDAMNSAGLPHSGIAALASGRDGRLWIGLEFGGVRVMRDGKIASAPEARGLPEDIPVRDVVEGEDGTLWVGTERGLWRLGPDGAARVSPPVQGEADVRVLVRQGGVVWARTREHGLWRIEAGVARLHPDVPGCLGTGLAAAGDAIYVACDDGLWRSSPDGSSWQLIVREPGLVTIFVDARGDLWFGSRQGLARWREGRVDVRPRDLALSDWRLRAVHQDSRGDLWLGTFSGGLARLHAGAVRAFGQDDGLGVSSSTAVLASDDGDVFVGSLTQGLVLWRPGQGQVAVWTQADGLPGETPWSLARDPRDPEGLWVAGDAGLAWLKDGRLAPTGPEGVGYVGGVRVLYVDPLPPHTLWLSGTGRGAVELTPEGPRLHDEATGLGLRRARFFHRDRSGRLLAGGLEGLYQFEGGRWSRLSVGGRPMRALTAIAESPAGDLWLASGMDGLVWSSGSDARVFGDAEWLPFLPVHSLRLDAHGGLWLSGNDGLARIAVGEHARWRQGGLATLPIDRLGTRDGLRDAECNGWGFPAGAALADGRLVYPTLTGVALLDPAFRTDEMLAPADIYVDQAWSGERALPTEGVVALDPEERSLRVAFSAIQMLRPEALSFRYRLDGYDEDWIPVAQATESNYARLTPGNYRFRLQARLPGTDWVESSRGFELRALPYFWETPGFSAALLALAALAVIGLFAWRQHIDGRHAAVLEQARTFLREVIDTSPNPIFARRRDGSYSLANRAAAEVYGLAPGQVEDRRPAAPESPLAGMPALEAMDAEVIASGRKCTLAEVEIVDHAGRGRWFRVMKYPLFDAAGGQVEQVIGTAVEITDHKLATLELMRKETTLRDSRSEARLLARRLLRAQEDERRHLARELHDDLTQRLAGLAMLAWGTLQSLERDPGRDVVATLREVALELERVANDVQLLSRDLHPPALETLGLAEALRAECATFAKRAQMVVEFACDELPFDPPPEVGLAIYRIVQEALRNARTHSGARVVRVVLRAGAEGLRLEVGDDGAGFDAADPSRREGLGLSSLRERARLAGGELEVTSSKGKGTRLVFRAGGPAQGQGT
jgi:PAS domain S-box-containing protein